MSNIISIPALLWDRGATADGGRRLWITTNEIQSEEQLRLIMQYGDNKHFGFFFFKEAPIKPEDTEAPVWEGEFPKEKSPSERLRAVLFVYWQQNGAKGEFNDFYRKQMDRIINKIKENLT